MGYFAEDGQYSGTDDVTLVVSRTITANFDGPALNVRRGVAALTLNVTAINGTPTLDVTIQTRKDATDSWRTVGTFAQKTSVTSERKCFAGLDRQVRASCAFGSTTSITFSVSGDAR